MTDSKENKPDVKDFIAKFNRSNFIHPSPMYLPCPPYFVIDLETVTTDTEQDGVFEIAIGFVNNPTTNADEYDFDRMIRSTFVEPDEFAVNPDTIEFLKSEGYTEDFLNKITAGKLEDQIPAMALPDWIVDNYNALLTDSGLRPSEDDQVLNLVKYMPIYFKGPDFDLGFIKHYFNKYRPELDMPWRYSCVGDIRTLRQAAGAVFPIETQELVNRDHNEKRCELFANRHSAVSDTAWQMFEVNWYLFLLMMARDTLYSNQLSKQLEGALARLGEAAHHLQNAPDMEQVIQAMTAQATDKPH